MSLSSIDIAALPDPSHLTLLFKYSKSTTLLSVQPSQTFASVKAALLATLHSLKITTFPHTTIPLPTDPEDLDLGITRDRHNGRETSKGWISVDDPEALTLASSSKSGKKRGAAAPDQLAEKVADLDLKDGSYVAYRLKTGVEDLMAEDMDDKMAGVDERGQMAWNVVVPSFFDEEEEEIGGGIGRAEPHDADDDDNDDDDDMGMPIPTPRNKIAR